MFEYDYAPTVDTCTVTVEADLTDWSEQHHTVALSDDDYPHTTRRYIAATGE